MPLKQNEKNWKKSESPNLIAKNQYNHPDSKNQYGVPANDDGLVARRKRIGGRSGIERSGVISTSGTNVSLVILSRRPRLLTHRKAFATQIPFGHRKPTPSDRQKTFFQSVLSLFGGGK
jgi:hypothetical protein